MSKNKYIKYKNKYLSLKNDIDNNQIGGYKNIDIIKNLIYKKLKLLNEDTLKIEMSRINNIDNPNINILQDFYEGSNKIKKLFEERLDKYKKYKKQNNINNDTIINKLNIISPGDSPSKIIIYFEILNLVNDCVFYSFPLSTSESQNNNTNKIIKYVKNNLKLLFKYWKHNNDNNIDNEYNEDYIIFDYIASGSSLKNYVLPAINKKLPEQLPSGNFLFFNYNYDDKKPDEEIQSIIEEDLQVFNDNMHHFLNLSYFYNKCLGYLMHAENYNSRCLDKFNPSINKNKEKIKDSICIHFIYDTIIYFLSMQKNQYDNLINIIQDF
jgi:hypothetical protein